MKDFEELYNKFQNNKEIIETATEAKKERKKRNTIIFSVILTVDIILITVLYIVLKSIMIFMFLPMIFIANVFALIISLIIPNEKQKEYEKVFKEQIIKELLENVFDDIEYFPDKKMPQKIYDEGKYGGYYNRYHSDDYLEAKINKKFLIDMAEVLTQRVETKTDSDGHTSTETTTLFHGIFAKITIDKSINSDLRITDNYRSYKNRLEMDSSEFENKFNVFASDKIIGMQLLTADIMEELIDFKNKTKDYFDIFINENNIYLRFHCGTMFETVSFKNGQLNEKGLRKYYDVLAFINKIASRLIEIIDEVEI